MFQRKFWIEKIKESWKKKSIIWLSGVRRAGKTSLCKTIKNIEYFDCEIPKVRRELEDPEIVLDKLKNKTVVIDEIHRLENPSELLKIAADYYRDIKIIATGSSTLSASAKFKDTLTGRKENIYLTPMINSDLAAFKNDSLEHRLLKGGLPPFFLTKNVEHINFQDWMDSYWAKDVQELFRLLNKFSFQKFAELIFLQSGGIFEATRFTKPCEVSRTAINNYLKVLEETFVIHIIRPFSSYKPTEITSAPKVYAFDTGFVCYYKGWDKLRKDDLGILWEHFVLNELMANLQSRQIQYWRDKNHHEIDFVLPKRGKSPIAIECKSSSNNFDSRSLLAFRRRYPKGENFVVCMDVKKEYGKQLGDEVVKFVSLNELIKNVLG